VDSGGQLTNIQYKAIWNCHNESPLYSKYILVKMGGKAKNRFKKTGMKEEEQIMPIS
jgi:hypothetical protein